jgi:membrane-associated protease RseP (regulator of RpoE activity)
VSTSARLPSIPPDPDPVPPGARHTAGLAADSRWALPLPTPRRSRGWVHLLLFVLTGITTTLAGAHHYQAFASAFGTANPAPALSIWPGFLYSGTVLAILGCHELGHYLACRYYAVDASLPYFLPLPPVPFFTGTLGAFIRIREPIRTKRVLFDIGVAGPLAGFIVALPAVLVGIWLSPVLRVPADMQGYELGEPLLFKAASWLLWGPLPAGFSLNLHPIGLAAWFGLLATALNLFPIGQLDGGHISYAALGRRSTWLTYGGILSAMVLAYFSISWVVWTVVMVALLFIFGPRHPRTIDEHVPLDRARRAVAVLALVIFIVCFTPAPIEVIQLLPR